MCAPPNGPEEPTGFSLTPKEKEKEINTMRAQRYIYEKEIRKAITYITEDEMLSRTEIREFVSDFYGNQFFVPFELLDAVLAKMVANRWEFLNCLRVNGVSFFWFDDNAYNAMKTWQEKSAPINKICKKVYWHG